MAWVAISNVSVLILPFAPNTLFTNKALCTSPGGHKSSPSSGGPRRLTPFSCFLKVSRPPVRIMVKLHCKASSSRPIENSSSDALHATICAGLDLATPSRPFPCQTKVRNSRNSSRLSFFAPPGGNIASASSITNALKDLATLHITVYAGSISSKSREGVATMTLASSNFSSIESIFLRSTSTDGMSSGSLATSRPTMPICS
mmetsp:Transcript_69553/g.137633  ORF Transcript_69553/g.137633 Transcript_69553/m.137633 type:complete len:202 (-) Transcript_69553:668-1273(-)